MQKKETQEFVSKATNAIPKWAWGVLGTFIGIMMTLQVTGYNGSLNRVIEAYVKRIEKSADTLDASAGKMADVLARLDRADNRLNALDSRVTTIEKHQAEIDRTFHKPAK